MAPFPYMAMTAIMTGLISQQVVQMSIFAYAGFMVEYLGAVDDKDEAGYYAGLLSSGFMIGRIFSSHFWGLVADRYGSRIVLICGLVATAVLSIAFGFSKVFVYAFFCRFLLGLFNGMMTASKTLVSEVCGTEHGTVGMGLITSAWSLGAVLGPGVGGMLAEPADNFPGTFSQDGVFGRNPYLLSNVVGAGLAILSLPLVLIFLRDTKASEMGNPGETAWYPSWCTSWCSFLRGGGNGDDNGSNHTDNRYNCDAGGGHAISNGTDCGDSIETCGTRNPSWIQPKAIPSTTGTDGRHGWIDGSFQSALEALGMRKSTLMKPEKKPATTDKAGDPADRNTKRQPSWMQLETIPPTATDGRSSSTGGSFRSALEAIGIRKPSWPKEGAVPASKDRTKDSTHIDTERKPSWMQVETMPPTAADGSVNEADYGAERARRKTKEIKQDSLLAQRHIVALLFMEAVYSVSFSGFDEVYALWALSSASKGGLEWSSEQIGQVFFACGLLVLLFELAAVPYLTPWLGVKLSQRLGSVFEVPIYFLFPLLSRMEGSDLQVALIALVLLFTCYVGTNSFFVGTALAINTATGADRRGELNGISSMITSLMRAISPIVSASLFAYSINSDHGFPVNHHLAFAFIGSMRLIAACIGWNRITDNGNME